MPHSRTARNVCNGVRTLFDMLLDHNQRQSKLNELSNATDSLELWVKVQLLWTSLESVFMGGDIAKQMPLEAKKFVKIDKDWSKTMAKGRSINFV